MEDFLALSSYLDAHVLDFGTDVLDPDSAPSLPSGPCGQAPRHGARAGCKEPKPPEQDLDFTIAFHKAESNTNHERIGEPLGIGVLRGTPKIIARVSSFHPKWNRLKASSFALSCQLRRRIE
jgi:hypothetical protein